MGYGMKIPAQQVGGLLRVWVMRGYGLIGVWDIRGSTVIPFPWPQCFADLCHTCHICHHSSHIIKYVHKQHIKCFLASFDLGKIIINHFKFTGSSLNTAISLSHVFCTFITSLASFVLFFTDTLI